MGVPVCRLAADALDAMRAWTGTQSLLSMWFHHELVPIGDQPRPRRSPDPGRRAARRRRRRLEGAPPAGPPGRAGPARRGVRTDRRLDRRRRGRGVGRGPGGALRGWVHRRGAAAGDRAARGRDARRGGAVGHRPPDRAASRPGAVADAGRHPSWSPSPWPRAHWSEPWPGCSGRRDRRRRPAPGRPRRGRRCRRLRPHDPTRPRRYVFPVARPRPRTGGRTTTTRPTDIFAACGTASGRSPTASCSRSAATDRYDPSDGRRRGAGRAVRLAAGRRRRALLRLAPALGAAPGSPGRRRVRARAVRSARSATPAGPAPATCTSASRRPCAGVGDWWIRRGVIWPWSYLDSWRAGGHVSPVRRWRRLARRPRLPRAPRDGGPGQVNCEERQHGQHASVELARPAAGRAW